MANYRAAETVRLQEGYGQFIAKANGLEQLLCHTMDWLLRQVGYCNIGIWLASASTKSSRAFMKYTIAAEPPLMEAMQKNLLKLTMRRGFLRRRCGFEGYDARRAEIPGRAGHPGDQLHVSGRVAGGDALFRDHNTPFSNDDIAAIKTMSPLFALSLGRAVKINENEGEDPPEGNQPPPSNEKPKKKDPADWWKNGEAPPFRMIWDFGHPPATST